MENIHPQPDADYDAWQKAWEVAGDVIEGLESYHSILTNDFVSEQMRSALTHHYRSTGNDQLDYERLRDECEKMLSGLRTAIVTYFEECSET